MTTGQLVFYCGAALLALTVILIIIFAIKRPKYQPENAVVPPAAGVPPTNVGTATTAKASPASSGTVLLPQSSAGASSETVLLPQSGSGASAETVLLPQAGNGVSPETVLLSQAEDDKTELLPRP